MLGAHDYTHDRRPPGVFSRADFSRAASLDCDVVIVGSGAGGSTAAAELAEAGFDVIVLEEGSYFGTKDFNTNAAKMVRNMYREGGGTMALGHPPVFYQEGRVVGGSSVINGGMSWRTPERILDSWQSEHGLTGLNAKTMEPYFERVERRIHVAYQDPHTIGRDNALLRKGAEGKGWRYDENLRNQLHCAGSNNCAFGCPTGAKQSTLRTYVPRALHFGARIMSNFKVDRITFDGKRATGVAGHIVAEDGGQGHPFSVRAKLVISACGSIHTPALFSRSGVRTPSKALGANLSLHPNVKVVAIFDEDVRGWEGVHQAYQVREFEDEGIVTMAAVNIPPSILAFSMPHHGPLMEALMGDYHRIVTAAILCEDTTRGRVAVGPGGAPIPTYNLARLDIDRILVGVRRLCELLLEAGARKVILPFHGACDVENQDDLAAVFDKAIPRTAMEVLTVHLMGTAKMAGQRSQGVTDGFGRVHNTDGLFICDASLFPSPIGVNPCQTIQALSTRNAAHIIENKGRYLQ